MAATMTPVDDALVFTELDGSAAPKKMAAAANVLSIPGHLKVAISSLQEIRDELKSFYIGDSHHEAIDNMILALVIGEHLLMLGDPGNGKSDMVRELVSRIQEQVSQTRKMAHTFHILLSKATDPSEVVGGINIPEMQKTGRYERQAEGMMPEAFTAFLDECFKANSVVLNFLLGMLNEREFTNAGKTIQIPLHSVFLASNEGPESEELNAFYDRILFRHEVCKPKDLDQRRQILKNIYLKKRGEWAWKHGRVTIDRAHLVEMAELVDQVSIPDGVFDSLKEIEAKLESVGKKDTTVRRLGKALKVLQGQALLNGRTAVGRTDLKALIHVLADKEQDKDELRQIIGQMAAGPYLTKLEQYATEARSRRDSYLGMGEVTDEQRRAKVRAGLAIKTELVKILRSVNATLKEAQTNGEDLEELKPFKAEVVKINAEVVDYINAKVGVTNPVDTASDDDLF